ACTDILTAAARQSAHGPHGHVVVTDDLAAETNAGQSPGSQDGFFGLGHLLRLAREEFDPAGGAAGVAAAGMELIDLGFVLQRQHQALALGHLELPDSLDSQLRHDNLRSLCWPLA